MARANRKIADANALAASEVAQVKPRSDQVGGATPVLKRFCTIAILDRVGGSLRRRVENQACIKPRKRGPSGDVPA